VFVFQYLDVKFQYLDLRLFWSHFFWKWFQKSTFHGSKY